jgi:hypothetical protein
MFVGYSHAFMRVKTAVAGLGVACLVAGCGKAEELHPLTSAAVGGLPVTMTVRIKNYAPQPGKVFQNLFVSNFSAKARKGRILKVSSRDGLDDAFKKSLNADYGFLLTGPETAVTGFADTVIFNLGVKTPQQPLLYCAGSQMDSSTNDAFIYNDDRIAGSPQVFLGLRDCEKNYLGLDANSFNNAADGIPDYLKIQCGLNPADKFDAFVSSAGDGIANIDKCKMHLPIDEDARTDYNQLFAYKYSIKTLDDGSKELIISNIPVVDKGVENFLAFYITESDTSNQTLSLYTAFAVLTKDYSNKTFEFDYWADIPSHFVNQRILESAP